MSAPTTAKLSCRHVVEVVGRAAGDKVPCYRCTATNGGAAPMRTVKELRQPAEPVEPAEPRRAVDDPAELATGARIVRRALARKAMAEPAEPRKQTSGSSRRDGPPAQCPGAGQRGLDERPPGEVDRCRVCTLDLAPVRRDGTLGSHKLLRPR